IFIALITLMFVINDTATADIYTLSLHDALPILIATYSVARHGSRRSSLIGALAAVACLLFFDFAVTELQEPGEVFFHWLVVVLADRKSTRLNSSHVKISYAVFCLKKKNKI